MGLDKPAWDVFNGRRLGQKLLPMAFGEALEREKALESELSKFSVRHSVADAPLMRHNGDAFQDPSLG